MGCSAGRVDSVEFIHVKSMKKTFVCKVPTVEEAIPIGLVGIDILHRGFG